MTLLVKWPNTKRPENYSRFSSFLRHTCQIVGQRKQFVDVSLFFFQRGAFNFKTMENEYYVVCLQSIENVIVQMKYVYVHWFAHACIYSLLKSYNLKIESTVEEIRVLFTRAKLLLLCTRMILRTNISRNFKRKVIPW